MVIVGVDPGWVNCGVCVLEVVGHPYEYQVLHQSCIDLCLKKCDSHQSYAEQIHTAFSFLPEDVQSVAIEGGDAGGAVLKKLVTAMASYFWERYRCRVSVIAPRSNRLAWKLGNHKNRLLNKDASLARWESAITEPKIVSDHEAEAAFLAVVGYLYQGSRKPRSFSVDISQCRIMTTEHRSATPQEIEGLLRSRSPGELDETIDACDTWLGNLTSYTPLKRCPFCGADLMPSLNLVQSGPKSKRPGQTFQKCHSLSYGGCGNFFSYLAAEAQPWMEKKLNDSKAAIQSLRDIQPPAVQAARIHHATQHEDEHVDICGGDGGGDEEEDPDTDDEWDCMLERFSELAEGHERAQEHIRTLQGYILKKKQYAGERSAKLSRAARGRVFERSDVC